MFISSLFFVIFLFIERYLYIRKTARMDNTFLYSIREMLVGGNVQGAVNYCKNSQYPIAKLLERGLNRLGSPIRDIENAIENTARVEIYNMEKNLGILSAIAKIAPMFGFLGTVSGMVTSFDDIVRNMGQMNIVEAAASGIMVSLLTTVLGLVVGIPAFVMFNYFTSVINEFVLDVEESAAELIESVTLQLALAEKS